MEERQARPSANLRLWVIGSFLVGFAVASMIVLFLGYVLVAQVESLGNRALNESRGGRAKLVQVKDADESGGAAFLLIDDTRWFFLVERGDRHVIIGASGLNLGDLRILPSDLESPSDPPMAGIPQPRLNR